MSTLCTDIVPAQDLDKAAISRDEKIFAEFVNGDSLDVIAVKRGLPYVEVAAAVQNRIAAAASQRNMLPEVEFARLTYLQKKLQPAVDAGDPSAIRESRACGESKRILYDANRRADLSDGTVLKISFAFGASNRVRVAEVVGGSGEDDLRSSPHLLDSDRNEDGQDDGGGGVDLRGDSPR